MVSGSKEVAISQAIGTNDTFSGSFSLPNGNKGLMLLLKSNDFTDGSYTAELFHSPDGVNFASLGSTAALTAAGMQFLAISASSFHVFRIDVTSTGVTTGATIEAALCHTPNRL